MRASESAAFDARGARAAQHTDHRGRPSLPGSPRVVQGGHGSDSDCDPGSDHGHAQAHTPVNEPVRVDLLQRSAPSTAMSRTGALELATCAQDGPPSGRSKPKRASQVRGLPPTREPRGRDRTRSHTAPSSTFTHERRNHRSVHCVTTRLGPIVVAPVGKPARGRKLASAVGPDELRASAARVSGLLHL